LGIGNWELAKQVIWGMGEWGDGAMGR
jgi:hypothetical protein